MLDVRGRTRLTLVATMVVALSASPTVAATFAVDSTMDASDLNPGDGLCLTAQAECTLRAAIEESSALDGNDTVSIPSGTFVLTTGGLVVDDEGTTITGAGASLSVVDGNGAFDVLTIQRPGATIENVTIQNGAAGVLIGNGIAPQALRSVRILGNQGRGLSVVTTGTTVEDSLIQDNDGGGVFGDNVTITRSTIAGNRTTGRGGGIHTGFAGVTVIESAIVNNVAEGSGGGIWSSEGFRAFDCLIANNVSGESGGGVRATTGVIVNTTITGNRAAGGGGGLVGSPGPINVSGSTVVNNVADDDNDGSGDGGGVVGGGMKLGHTIVALNVDRGGETPDCSGSVDSQGYNLIQVPTGCSFSGNLTGNLTGADPSVGPLADNGGPTLTHALLSGSAAIDAGDPAGCTDPFGDPIVRDQRGVERPLRVACDIGAYEFACANGGVDLGEDCDDSNLTDGDCCSANCQFEPLGSLCPDDGDVCTDDECDGSGTCEHPFNSAPCDDGDHCTEAETCAAGICGNGAPACFGVRGRKFVVRNPRAGDPGEESRRKVTVVARETDTDIASLVGDPTVSGATLRVIVSGMVGSDQVIPLDAAGWRALGNRGFAWRNTASSGFAAPVKSVLLLRRNGSTGPETLLKLRLRGNVGSDDLDVLPPAPGTEAVASLSIVGGHTYCVGLGGPYGGSVRGNDTRTFRIVANARNPAGDPLNCPAPVP